MNEKNNDVKPFTKPKRPSINRIRFGSNAPISHFLQRQFRLNNGEEVEATIENTNSNDKKLINKRVKKSNKYINTSPVVGLDNKIKKEKPVRKINKQKEELKHKDRVKQKEKLKHEAGVKQREELKRRAIPKKPPVKEKQSGMFKQIKDKITGNNDDK